MIQYTLYRLLIFGAFLVLMMALNVEPLWAVIIAAIASMITSLFLLRRQRENLARQLEAKVDERRVRREQRLASERTAEEEEDDEVEGR